MGGSGKSAIPSKSVEIFDISSNQWEEGEGIIHFCIVMIKLTKPLFYSFQDKTFPRQSSSTVLSATRDHSSFLAGLVSANNLTPSTGEHFFILANHSVKLKSL